MVSIQEEINILNNETERSVEDILDGSDYHLDLILSIKTPLESLAVKLEALNESLYTTLPKMSGEKINETLIPDLRKLNKSCVTLIGAIRTSFLYQDVRIALKKYTLQHDFLMEILHDTYNFKILKDEELDNILSDLNDI